MKKPLPALSGLRAFEAAARHLSFTKAAAELNVTPAAISQLIRQLEEQVGSTLFARTTRALDLTEPARAALPYLREAFDQLYAGARELRGDSGRNMITVSVTPSFGSCWLLSRLKKFHTAHPGVAVRIDAREELVDFQRDDVDIAIRQGRGTYKGLKSDLLISDVALVVCAPQFLPDGKSFKTPQSLAGKTLLHVDWQIAGDAAPSWSRWARYHKAEGLDLSGGLRFGMEDMAVRAALAGMGVALVTKAFISDDLSAGRLVRALPRRYDMPTVFHHFLVYPQINEKRRKVSLFRDWLLQQANT